VYHCIKWISVYLYLAPICLMLLLEYVMQSIMYLYESILTYFLVDVLFQLAYH